MRAPCGIVEIREFYGDPAAYIRADGTPSPLWDLRMTQVELPGPLPLGWIPHTMVHTVRVNEAAAGETEAVLAALKKAGAWDYMHTFDGGYTWRAQKGSTYKLSMHAFGGALDFNAGSNQMGTAGDMARVIVEVFEGNGWEWGGRWKRTDPMHFQYARGY